MTDKPRLTEIRVVRGHEEGDHEIVYDEVIDFDWERTRYPGVLFMTVPDVPDNRLLGCPQCGMFGNPAKHTLTLHEDGTVTLSPSVLVGCCGAHFFIERNRIRWC